LRQEAATGLTPSQLALLAVVERDGPLTLGALADSERVAPPTITRVVAKLEEAGLLARERDARDRRVVRVAVTPAARTLLAASRRRKTGWLTARLQHLPDAEIAQLDAAVAILERVLEDPL
jgi:DNA-binding MarR family transcriptional regulator